MKNNSPEIQTSPHEAILAILADVARVVQLSEQEVAAFAQLSWTRRESLWQQSIATAWREMQIIDDAGQVISTKDTLRQMTHWTGLIGLATAWEQFAAQLRDFISAAKLASFAVGMDYHSGLQVNWGAQHPLLTMRLLGRKLVEYGEILVRTTAFSEAANDGMPPMLKEEDVTFLQAALELGCDKHCVPAANIRERAEGKESRRLCDRVRSQLDRLQHEGLIVSKKGIGTMITPKGTSLMKRLTQPNTTQSPHLGIAFRWIASSEFLTTRTEYQPNAKST